MAGRDQLVAVAKTQLGVRYWSMHWGPKGSAEPGWGCAMFVAYCFQQVLGTDYYGSCWNFWGDAIGAPQYNQGGGEFEQVPESDILPGDVAVYFPAGASLGYSTAAGHVALCVGNGEVIGAMGNGIPGEASYLNIGISQTPVGRQSIGGEVRFIRCTRLGDEGGGDLIPLRRQVTVRVDQLRVRDAPSTVAGREVARYNKGDRVNIDGVTFGDDGNLWGHYVGASSGRDRYISLGSMENAR